MNAKTKRSCLQCYLICLLGGDTIKFDLSCRVLCISTMVNKAKDRDRSRQRPRLSPWHREASDLSRLQGLKHLVGLGKSPPSPPLTFSSRWTTSREQLGDEAAWLRLSHFRLNISKTQGIIDELWQRWIPTIGIVCIDSCVVTILIPEILWLQCEVSKEHACKVYVYIRELIHMQILGRSFIIGGSSCFFVTGSLMAISPLILSWLMQC